MIFDTDVFIWVQKGQETAVEAIEAARAERYASIITYMEFIQGSPDKRTLRTNRDFFRAASIMLLPVTEPISFRASRFVEQYSLSHHMHLNDALIAATAIESGLALVTGNAKHYRQIRDLNLTALKV